MGAARSLQALSSFCRDWWCAADLGVGIGLEPCAERSLELAEPKSSEEGPSGHPDRWGPGILLRGGAHLRWESPHALCTRVHTHTHSCVLEPFVSACQIAIINHY